MSTAGTALVAAGLGTAVTVACSAAWLQPARDAEPVLAGAALPLPAAALSAGADALALEQGRVYYVQLCLHCHGALGDGRGEWAWRVTPRPSNLAAARTQRRSDAELFHIVSEARPGTPMVGWRRQLSEGQRWQLVAYLRRLAAAQPVEARSERGR